MQLTEGDSVIITDASQPNKLKVGLICFLCRQQNKHLQEYRPIDVLPQLIVLR